jgi:uncharacterized protein YjbJ (UPF0337 family)
MASILHRHLQRQTGRAAARPLKETQRMNKDRIEGNWKQLKGKIKQKWGDLTDDEIDQAEGSTEILAGKLQERYGITRDEADRQLDEFMRRERKI